MHRDAVEIELGAEFVDVIEIDLNDGVAGRVEGVDRIVLFRVSAAGMADIGEDANSAGGQCAADGWFGCRSR